MADRPFRIASMTSAAASDINLLTKRVNALTKEQRVLIDLVFDQRRRIESLEEQMAADLVARATGQTAVVEHG